MQTERGNGVTVSWCCEHDENEFAACPSERKVLLYQPFGYRGEFGVRNGLRNSAQFAAVPKAGDVIGQAEQLAAIGTGAIGRGRAPNETGIVDRNGDLGRGN